MDSTIELRNLTSDQAKDGVFQEVFSGVTPEATYWARVMPIFFVDTGGGDGYLEEGVPSPPSNKVYVTKEDCSSTVAPFVIATAASIPSSFSTDTQTTTATTTIISTFKTALSGAERLSGPRDCNLVGLSTDWAAFQWQHGSISCGLGELIGYELSLASLGQDKQPSRNEEVSAEKVYVKRYRADTFTTAIVAQDLLPGHKYRAQIFALHEQGSIGCIDIKMGGIELTAKNLSGSGSLDFTTFSEYEAQSTPRVLIRPLDRNYDSFSVLVELSQHEVAELSHLWISAFPVESRLPTAVDLGGRGASVQTASGVMHQFSFASNIHPSTRYGLYGWASPTSEQKFIGTTLDIWTSPKPFTSFPNFVLPSPQLIEVLDNTLVVRFPNISGYYGGPVTDYFIAICPGFVPPMTDRLGEFSLLRRRLSLPSIAWIVFHSRSFPHHAVTVGDEAVEVEVDLPGFPERHAFTDPPLEPDSNYTLFIAVVSSVSRNAVFKSDAGESFVVSPTITRFIRTASLKPSRGSFAQSFGIGFAIIICILCLIGLIVFIWWRFLRRRFTMWKKQYPFNMRPNRRTSGGSTLTTIEDFMTALPRSYVAWSFPINLHDPRFLVIDPQRGPDNNLLGTKGIQEIAETFFREYKSLPVNKALPQVQAKRAVNRGKNRCLYSLPYDHNRVQIHRRGDSQTDYINASYISGYLRRKAYICAQSPFNAVTASDFWALIEQCGVAQIVTLDNLIEGGIVKCSKYWPDKNRPRKTDDVDRGYCDSLSGSERRQYDTVAIEAEEVQEFANFTIRRFRVTNMADDDNVVHPVTQFHYHRWRCQIGSDDSEDDDTSERDENDLVNNFDILAFLDFYFHVKMSTKMEDGPILVHCEDGVTRSSVFIAFDVLLQQLMHEHTVTVGRTCASLRRARQCAVPTARHFALLYDLLFEAGIAGHAILDLDIRSALASLNQRNVTAGFTYLKEQWYLLQNYLSITILLPLASPLNAASIVIDGDDAINAELSAVWVDGLTVRKDILLVRAPRTTSALVAFWQIVFKRRISCIVNMEPSCFEPEGEAVCFWPPSSNDPYGRTYEEEALFGIQSVMSAFTQAPDIGPVIDCEGETTTTTTRNAGPWFQLGDLQLAQVGRLMALPPPLPLSPRRRGRHRERGSKKVIGCLFKQKVTVRKLLPIPPQKSHRSQSQYLRRAGIHNVEILHFKTHWRFGNQVPPRGAMLQALEAFREARGVGPAAVLCADGTTHSGLFVAAYSITERLTRDRFLDLFHTLKALKLRRGGAICSVRQLHFLYRLMVSWVDEVMGTRRSRKLPAHLEDSRTMATSRSSHQDLSTSAVFSSSNLSTDKRRSFGAGEFEEKNTSNNSLVPATTTEDDEDEDDELGISSPRPVNVLYRYYNDELSRLLIVKNMSFNQKSVRGWREEPFNI
ncbi:hypothetical protein Aperf_G00000129368 [Anoplocephala perfoliata]